jgi:hypothetical protein
MKGILEHSSVRLMLVLVACVLILSAAGCATARLASGWASGPVTADGLDDDWSGLQVCSTMKDGLQMTVANDAERLYVMAKFRANDPRWSRAAGAGMTVRVTDARRRTMSFRLPEGPGRRFADDELRMTDEGIGRDRMPADSGPGPGGMPGRWRQAHAELAGKLVVTDLDKVEIPVPADGSQGPAAAFLDNNAICLYEFSIPLSDSTFGHYSIDTRPGTGLHVTVTAGPSDDERKAMREQMGRRGPPGGGEMPSGGGPGGPSEGRSGQGGPGRGGSRGGPPGVQTLENP